MRRSLSIHVIALSLSLTTSALAQEVPSDPNSMRKTLSVDCDAKRVLSPLALSPAGQWSAYVEVTTAPACLHTTRLWVTKGKAPYRLAYLMPPKRTAVENGMQILGWAEHSRLLLAVTDESQYGSDAPDVERVIAIDAETGLVYEPQLEAMIDDRKEKHCAFRVEDAGFSDDPNVVILIRARFYTFIPEGEDQAVDPAKACGNSLETWSFNFATGVITRVQDAEPLKLSKRFLSNRLGN